jgi:hypothetical protein
VCCCVSVRAECADVFGGRDEVYASARCESQTCVAYSLTAEHLESLLKVDRRKKDLERIERGRKRGSVDM